MALAALELSGTPFHGHGTWTPVNALLCVTLTEALRALQLDSFRTAGRPEAAARKIPENSQPRPTAAR
jgi:hypothetical protein